MHTVNYSVSVMYEIYTLKIKQKQEYLPHYTWYVMFQIHKNNYASRILNEILKDDDDDDDDYDDRQVNKKIVPDNYSCAMST